MEKEEWLLFSRKRQLPGIGTNFQKYMATLILNIRGNILLRVAVQVFSFH